MKLAVLLVFSLCTALPALAQVTITQTPEQIAVEIDGKPFTVFYIGGKDLNRPYLHPLRSAGERSSIAPTQPVSSLAKQPITRTMPACSTATAT